MWLIAHETRCAACASRIYSGELKFCLKNLAHAIYLLFCGKLYHSELFCEKLNFAVSHIAKNKK